MDGLRVIDGGHFLVMVYTLAKQWLLTFRIRCYCASMQRLLPAYLLLSVIVLVLPLRRADAEERRGLTLSNAKAEGIDEVALSHLQQRAKEEHSSALVVLRNGKLVLADFFGATEEPICAMSGSKSVAALAIMLLVREGRIRSLDDAAKKYIPAWNALSASDARSQITLRQMLNHTSGLDTVRAAQLNTTIAKRAATTTTVQAPGTAFRYNNNAVDMLSLVVRSASRQPLDAYLQTTLFQPLGIADAFWMNDADGNARAAGELMIHAIDLAKIGQLMLQRGRYGGKQILSAEQVQSLVSSQPLSSECGLLWWLKGEMQYTVSKGVLEQWTKDGIDGDIVDAAAPLIGAVDSDAEHLRRRISATLGHPKWLRLMSQAQRTRVPFWETTIRGGIDTWMASGWLGQYLVVVPEKQLVAVRMRRAVDADYKNDGEKNGYIEFWRDVRGLVRK